MYDPLKVFSKPKQLLILNYWDRIPKETNITKKNPKIFVLNL